jgi:hypothetical protein
MALHFHKQRTHHPPKVETNSTTSRWTHCGTMIIPSIETIFCQRPFTDLQTISWSLWLIWRQRQHETESVVVVVGAVVGQTFGTILVIISGIWVISPTAGMLYGDNCCCCYTKNNTSSIKSRTRPTNHYHFTNNTTPIRDFSGASNSQDSLAEDDWRTNFSWSEYYDQHNDSNQDDGPPRHECVLNKCCTLPNHKAT